MIDCLGEAKAHLQQAIQLRRYFHMHPEPSKHEFQTAAYIKKYLEDLGLQVQTTYGGDLPSVVAVIPGAQKGRTIALRADMDALHITEKNDIPYKSTVPGVMHACGHDCHCATLMETATILVKHQSELQGNVKLMFEPAEEDIGGAQFMIKNGVLDDVDAVVGMHCENRFPVGTVYTCPGEMEAASDRLIIKIMGKSAHGAMPHLGIDAMTMACHFILAVQTMMAREKDAFQSAIITFGTIQGGTARNIVCDEVVINGIIRSLNGETREFLNQRIKGLLAGITAAFGGSFELERQKSNPALYSNPQLTEFFNQAAGEAIGMENVGRLPHAFMGCDSFAYYAQEKPSIFFFLGTGNEKMKESLHSCNFNIDENSMVTGMAAYMAMVQKYLAQ